MNLVIFKYCLPVLLGYILFMGVSGRLNPFKKPSAMAERPAWMLGVWTALSVILVLGIGLHMAYGMTLEGARTLFKPSALLLGGLLLPGFIGYFLYRRAVENELDQNSRLAMADNIETTLNDDLVIELDNDMVDEIFSGEEFSDEDIDATIDATVLETAGEQLDFQETAKIEAAAMANPELQYSMPTAPVVEPGIAGSEQLLEVRAALEEERALREETEKHLMITRKAMSRLEAESRDFESSKADAVIELEEALEERVKLTSAAETRATREEERRLTSDNKIVELKQNLVKAKQELRLSTTARAKALGTANKSVAFARQAIQHRQRLEDEVSRLESQLTQVQGNLKTTREALLNRQSTIASLIKALETEKLRSKTNMTKVAKQMVLKDRQLRARKTREGIARSVEDKLTSRLVKKVAKARPLASDS